MTKKGRVKYMLMDKGYGFIVGEDGRDYFFHFSFISDDNVIQYGTLVEFEEGENHRGLCAVNVRKFNSRRVKSILNLDNFLGKKRVL